MRKSICTETLFQELPFYERFQAVREAGFEHLEFWSWEDKDVGRVADLLGQHRLRLASLSGDRPHSLILPEERGPYLDYLARSLAVAGRLGCRHIVLHSNGIEGGRVTSDGSGTSYARKVASMTRTLTEAARLAETAGVLLVLEALSNRSLPGYFLTGTAESADIVRVVGSPYLKILYDIWHMQQMEGDLVRHLTECFDVLGYVHIGDAPERQEPGTGEINFDRIMRTLAGLGYDGVLGFELYPSGSSAACCELLRRL